MKFDRILIILISIVIVSLFFVWRTFKYSGQKMKSQIIIIGTNAEYPPYTFIENDKIIGFDIDIAHEVFRRMDKKIKIKDMAWTALIPAIQLGHIHVIAAGMTATEERAKHAIFTEPYIEGDPLLVVSLSKNSPIKNISELKGKKVIVDEGYTADMYMSKKDDIFLIRTPSPVQGFQVLKSGRAEGYVIAKSSAQQFFNKYGKKEFNIIEIDDATESYSLAVSKKYSELLNDIQKSLDEMKQDGTIKKLKIKWKIQ